MISQDIFSDKDRLKAVEQGIVKAVKGLYEEGLAFTIVKAIFDGVISRKAVY